MGIGKILGEGVASTVKGVASVFGENREARGARAHEADMAVLEQYAAEFVARAQRTWWDSMTDGLNRLVRPVFALACFFSLIAVPLWPEEALFAAEALAAMPDGYWILLSIVVTFYFGGRMQIKSHDFKLKSGAVRAAENIAFIRRQLTGGEPEEEEAPRDETLYADLLADESRPMPNWAIAKWNHERQLRRQKEER